MSTKIFKCVKTKCFVCLFYLYSIYIKSLKTTLNKFNVNLKKKYINKNIQSGPEDKISADCPDL